MSQDANQARLLAVPIALGAAIGAAMGSATGHMAVWVALGVGARRRDFGDGLRAQQ